MERINVQLAGRRPAALTLFQDHPQGAATSAWAAVVAPAEAVGGHYCEDCQVPRRQSK